MFRVQTCWNTFFVTILFSLYSGCQAVCIGDDGDDDDEDDEVDDDDEDDDDDDDDEDDDDDDDVDHRQL